MTNRQAVGGDDIVRGNLALGERMDALEQHGACSTLAGADAAQAREPDAYPGGELAERKVVSFAESVDRMRHDGFLPQRRNTRQAIFSPGAVAKILPLRHDRGMGRGRPRKSTTMAENRIKEVRVARGLTLEQLAEMVELSPGTVQRHENGERGLSQKRLLAYAKALDCPIVRLLPSEEGAADIVADEARILFATLTSAQRRRWVQMGHLLAEENETPAKGGQKKDHPA